jgi:hypothetical protein
MYVISDALSVGMHCLCITPGGHATNEACNKCAVRLLRQSCKYIFLLVNILLITTVVPRSGRFVQRIVASKGEMCKLMAPTVSYNRLGTRQKTEHYMKRFNV